MQRVCTAIGRIAAACLFAGLIATGLSTAAVAEVKDNQIFSSTQMDLSYNIWDRGGSGRWEGQGWIGTDKNKFFWKTEGERIAPEFEEAELQLLYSRFITQFWDFQAGVRQDFKPRATTFAVLGIQGLAPLMFEIDVALFISDDGDVSARIEAEYDILVTNKLIVAPYITLDFSANEVENRSLGTGLTELEAGSQIRYLVTRDFAPFVDFRYSRLIGDTAALARAEGEEPGKFRVLLGARVRF